jgi:hypothetical protein
MRGAATRPWLASTPHATESPATLRSTPANSLAVRTGAVASCCPRLRSSSLVSRSVDLTSWENMHTHIHAHTGRVPDNDKAAHRSKDDFQVTTTSRPRDTTVSVTHPPLPSPSMAPPGSSSGCQ